VLLIQQKCNEVMSEKGFFRDMPPIEGAIPALKEMASMNRSVNIRLMYYLIYLSGIEILELLSR